MNESVTTVANTQKACSLHEDGRRLSELKRRVNEAESMYERAYWNAATWGAVARAEEEMWDAKREYRAALESSTTDSATTRSIS